MGSETKEVIAALMKPGAYDTDVEEVKLIQTHISYVFLTGKYVYKVKKPVDFEFLDFTTLEKRRFFCEEEVRVNRRLCKDMYLGVVPINRDKNGTIKVLGKGNIIEYAVKMKQIPQEAMMSNLLKRNQIRMEHINKIARLLADFHSKAETGENVDEYGSIDVIRKNWVQNFNQTRGLRGTLLDATTFDKIEGNVLGFIDKHTKLFNDRINEKKVRECHGDVHSGNIFIHDGRIYIFDAIEFNRMFSCSDVASEVAFLAMDLDYNDRHDLSKQFVKRYVYYSSDYGMLDLLAFYKCYRAYVRSKVASFRLNDPNIAQGEREEVEKTTEEYFDLAYGYSKQF